MEQFPDELIAGILCRVPAKDLWGACIYVCKSWLEILKRERYNLSFINLNLRHSTPCLVFHSPTTRGISVASLASKICLSSSLPFKIEMHFNCNWKVEEHFGFTFDDSRFEEILCGSTSDGVLLINRQIPPWEGYYYVVNPLMMQFLQLPHVPMTRSSRMGAITRITRDDGKLKVLTFGRNRSDGSLVWYVFTVGKSASWRTLDINCQLELSARDAWIPHLHCSISIDGVIYVPFSHKNHQNTSNIFVAFDLRNETARFLKIPARCKAKHQKTTSQDYTRASLFYTEGQLGCAITKEEFDGDIELWLLNDSRRSEWRQIAGIKLSDSLLKTNVEEYGSGYPRDIRILFLSSEILIIQIHTYKKFLGLVHSSYAWSIETNEFQKLSLAPHILVHKHSLVSLF